MMCPRCGYEYIDLGRQEHDGEKVDVFRCNRCNHEILKPVQDEQEE